MEYIRHGDCLLKPIDALPKNLRKTKSKTLAFGEVTGHHHSFSKNSAVTIFRDIEDQKYVSVESNARLSHQEHDTVTVPKGTYVLVMEREMNPFTESIQQVVD